MTDHKILTSSTHTCTHNQLTPVHSNHVTLVVVKDRLCCMASVVLNIVHVNSRLCACELATDLIIQIPR